MGHLSSCYFCGIALDEPLQVYRVPESTGASEKTTITLCQTCHQKLETVLDTAGVADLTALPSETSVEREPSGQTPATDQSGFEPDESETSSGPPGEEDGPAGESDADDILVDPEIDEPMEMDETPSDSQGDDREVTEAENPAPAPEDEEGESDQKDDTTGEIDATEGTETVELTPEDEPSDDEDDSEDIDSEASTSDSGFTQRDEIPDGEDDDREDESEDDEEGVPEELKSEMEPDVPEDLNAPDFESGESTDESAAADGDDGISDTAAEDELGLVDDEELSGEDETGDEEPFDADDEPETGGSGEPARTSISALEYNKVMRLLQNREFPVERGEIEVVAANAYDLAQSDCAQVIDLAVDRGLLQEDGGQLYRPDDG